MNITHYHDFGDFILSFHNFYRPGNGHFKIPSLFQVFHDRTNLCHFFFPGKGIFSKVWGFVVLFVVGAVIQISNDDMSSTRLIGGVGGLPKGIREVHQLYS